MQVPATQPLLVLATCQRPPEELPPVLLNFFQPHSCAPTSAFCHPSQHSNDHMLNHGNTSLRASSTNHAGTVRSSQVIVLESEAEAAVAGSWQEAVSRSAEAAARAVAAAATFSFQHKLQEQVLAASNQQVSHDSPPNAASPSSSQMTPRQGLNGPVAEADRADRKASLDGMALDDSEAGDPVQLCPKEGASKGAKAVNENELQQGLHLHSEVGLYVTAEVHCRKARIRNKSLRALIESELHQDVVEVICHVVL